MTTKPGLTSSTLQALSHLTFTALQGWQLALFYIQGTEGSTQWNSFSKITQLESSWESNTLQSSVPNCLQIHEKYYHTGETVAPHGPSEENLDLFPHSQNTPWVPAVCQALHQLLRTQTGLEYATRPNRPKSAVGGSYNGMDYGSASGLSNSWVVK